MAEFFRWKANELVIDVRIQTRASRDKIGEIVQDRLKIYLTAIPIDGKANNSLRKFLGKQFKTAPSNIKIVSGLTSRDKRIIIGNPQSLPALIPPKES